MSATKRGSYLSSGFIPALADVRLDIGDSEARFVVADSGASRCEVDCHAFDTHHLANPLFHSGDAQHRQHVADLNNARLHGRSPVGQIYYEQQDPAAFLFAEGLVAERPSAFAFAATPGLAAAVAAAVSLDAWLQQHSCDGTTCGNVLVLPVMFNLLTASSAEYARTTGELNCSIWPSLVSAASFHNGVLTPKPRAPCSEGFRLQMADFVRAGRKPTISPASSSRLATIV